MYTVTFYDYGCIDFGGEEYYADEKLFARWEAAEEFIRTLEDYEFIGAAYHFSCFEDEIPF